jgi:hypothetical protein
MHIWRLLPVGALALTVGMAPAAATPVAQVATPLVAKSDTQNGVTEARYGRRGHWRRGVGVGIGLGILGGIVAAEAYRPRAGYYYDDEAYDGPYYAPSGYAGDPRTLCAQNFRSFEWNTGLYTTYGGPARCGFTAGLRLLRFASQCADLKENYRDQCRPSAASRRAV